MNNNLTGLKQKTNQNNELNAVRQLDPGTSGINMDYIANNEIPEVTQVEKDINYSREQAMQNYIAGLPQVEEPSLTVSTTRPDLNTPATTETFTTRDEIMSKLGLMDENYNYTDTYTNYINQGGSPLPGYEYAHEELLAQERYDRIFQQVDQGTLSYDTALMEAYGKDILAAKFGIDVTSVAYWQNKFYNNDFSNPFTNRYLMDQVKQLADEYHQSRLSGEYANRAASDTQLASLIGHEIDEELSADKIRKMFDMDKLKEHFEDDDKFMQALHTGQITAEMRMKRDSKGNLYYLHTDGKLYLLDGKEGEGHGKLIMNGDKMEAIDLNGSGLTSTLLSVKSGFAGVFTGISDLLGIAGNTIWSLVSSVWGEGFADGFDRDDFFSWTDAMEGWYGDIGITDNWYVDLDPSHITTQDIFNFGGTLVGQIAGTMTLGSLMGNIGKAGQAGSGLIGYGQKLITEGNSLAGTLIKGTGVALKWQTGNFGSQTGALTLKAMWGRRLGASFVANAKNFLNDYRKMTMQADLYQDGATQGEILWRTAWTNALNFGIDSLISGGMDDNQMQIWKKTFGAKGAPDFLGMTTKEVAAKTAIMQAFTKQTNKQLKETALKKATGAFKELLFHRSFTIAANSAMDLAGNLLTGAIGANGLQDGKLEDFRFALTPENIMRSTVNTLWYSTRSQIKDWNVALETIGTSHKDFLDHIQEQMNKTKDAKHKMELADFRKMYIDALNDEEVKEKTYEERIIHAMQKTMKGDVPEALEKIIKKNGYAEANKYYQSLFTSGQALFEMQEYREKKTLDFSQDDGHKFFRILHAGASGLKWAGKKLSGVSGAQENYAKEKNEQKRFREQYDNILVGQSLIKLVDDSQEIVDKEVNTKKSPLEVLTGMDVLKNKKLKEELKDVIDDSYYYYMLPNNGKQTKERVLNSAALDVLEDLGYVKKVSENFNVYQVQPMYDQIDYMNTSEITKAVYNTVVTLQSEQVPTDYKISMVNDLVAGLLSKDDKSAMAETTATILDKLTRTSATHAANEQSETGKPLLSLDQAAIIFNDYVKNNKLEKVVLKSSKNLKASRAYSKLALAGEIIQKLQSGKEELIDLTDAETRSVLEDFYKQKSISQDTYNKITKLAEENKELFLTGNHLKSEKAYVEYKILNNLEKMAPLYGNKNPEEIENQISLYYKTQGVALDKESDLFKDIVKIAQEYDDIVSMGTTATLNEDGKVYIDLNTFRGNTTNKVTAQLINQALSSVKKLEVEDALQEYTTDLSKEFNNLKQWQLKNGSIIAFDTKTDKGQEELQQFLQDFNYDTDVSSPDALHRTLQNIEGVKNYYGDQIVLDIKPSDKIKDIKEAILNDGRVWIGDIPVDFKATYTTVNGEANIDLERAVLDSIQLSNIDPKIKVSLKQAPLLQLLPFLPSKDGKYDFTTPLATAMLGTNATQSPDKVAGKQSKTLAKQYNHIMLNSSGAETDVDRPLATYFTLDLIARELAHDPKHTNIPVSESEIKAFEEAGIIDYSIGRKKISNSKNFWELKGSSKSAGQMLVLKDSDTLLQDMQKAIVSKDFNVFRMLPMMFKESEIKHQGLTDLHQTLTTEGYESLPKGFARETGLRILNMRLPWDNENNSMYYEFLEDIKSHNDTLDYNPLKGSGFTAPEVKTYEDFDDWYKQSETSNNPYDILSRR